MSNDSPPAAAGSGFPASREFGAGETSANALRIYVHQARKHLGVMLYDWILAEARRMGIHGGSAFCATAGFGRHRGIEEQRFVELPADLPILVEFIVDDSEADRLLSMLRANRIHAFCTRTRTRVLLIDGEA